MPWFSCWMPMPEPDQRPFPDDPVAELPCAHGGAPLSGFLKATPEDFQVEELLGFPLNGEGEHLVLHVRKRALNTMEVVQRIAHWADVPVAAIGFAGLKDRHAVAMQHFSIMLPGARHPDTGLLESDDLQVIAVTRHQRKLQRGGLKGNRFVLCLGGLRGSKADAEDRLQAIRDKGFPNYFGPQRFGNGASNLVQAQVLLSGGMKHSKSEQRRMLLSAARSHVFNQVLAARVKSGSWDRALPGEVLLLNEGGRQLLASSVSERLRVRIGDGEMHPSGPLPGRAGHCLLPEGETASFEARCIHEQHLEDWVDSLVSQGVNAERRALRSLPEGLEWRWEGDRVLILEFALAAGCYATSLVRELMSDAGLA